MKKIYILTAFMLFSVSLFACPFCGCGVGNFYLGLMPDFDSKFIGVRYQYIHYETHINGDATQYSHDYYNTIELWGGINVGKKWQLLGFIPYQVNKQNTDDGVKQLNDLSDITVLANYRVFDKVQMHGSSSNEQELLIGGGFKLPTGKYHIDPNNPDTELGDVNSQAGTGSLDFLINATYNLRFNKFGINAAATYKINTTNNEHYQFGDRLLASSFAYYRVQMKKSSLSPNMGLMYQHSAPNNFNNEKVELTGGYLVMAAAGTEYAFNKISAGVNVQLPFSQNYAEGQTVAKPRLMVHVTFTL